MVVDTRKFIYVMHIWSHDFRSCIRRGVLLFFCGYFWGFEPSIQKQRYTCIIQIIVHWLSPPTPIFLGSVRIPRQKTGQHWQRPPNRWSCWLFQMHWWLGGQVMCHESKQEIVQVGAVWRKRQVGKHLSSQRFQVILDPCWPVGSRIVMVKITLWYFSLNWGRLSFKTGLKCIICVW